MIPQPAADRRALRETSSLERISVRQARDVIERVLWLLGVREGASVSTTTMVIYSELLHRRALQALTEALAAGGGPTLSPPRSPVGACRFVELDAGGASVLAIGSELADLAILTAHYHGSGIVIATRVQFGLLAAGIPALTADRDPQVRALVALYDKKGRLVLASSSGECSWAKRRSSDLEGTLSIATVRADGSGAQRELARRAVTDGLTVSSSIWRTLHARSLETLLTIER